MFYSQVILAKKGPLGNIWLAAHWDRKLTKAMIAQTDINATVKQRACPRRRLAPPAAPARATAPPPPPSPACSRAHALRPPPLPSPTRPAPPAPPRSARRRAVKTPTTPLSLRTSGHLLLGLSKIFAKKVYYLLTDSNDAYHRIQEHMNKGHAGGGGGGEDAGGAENDAPGGAKGKGKGRGGGADDVSLSDAGDGRDINMAPLGGGGADMPDLGAGDPLGVGAGLAFGDGGDEEYMDLNAGVGAPGSARRSAAGSARDIPIGKGRGSYGGLQRERTLDDVSARMRASFARARARRPSRA